MQINLYFSAIYCTLCLNINNICVFLCKFYIFLQFSFNITFHSSLIYVPLYFIEYVVMMNTVYYKIKNICQYLTNETFYDKVLEAIFRLHLN